VTNDRGDSAFAGIVSRPAQRALEAAGYSRLDDLAQFSEKQLLALHGFGPKGIRMVNAELEKRGLAIGCALENPSE
jgi:DNA-directed RNA polymerase alpha subunit